MWNAYHNEYWPAHYLIDQQGMIREVHYGEGAYVETENAIRSLLGMAAVEKEEVAVPAMPTTPETYLRHSERPQLRHECCPRMRPLTIATPRRSARTKSACEDRGALRKSRF